MTEGTSYVPSTTPTFTPCFLPSQHVPCLCRASKQVFMRCMRVMHTAGADACAFPPGEACGGAVAARHGDIAHRPTAHRGDATAAGEAIDRSSSLQVGGVAQASGRICTV